MDRPSKHFSWEEVTIRGGKAGVDLPRLTDAERVELRRVCACAEVIREAVDKPIRVTSGFRSGDSKQHGAGQALDIQVDGMSPRALLELIRTLDMPFPLRQVIAESNHAARSSLDQPMGRNGGLWVHIAVQGVAGEWARPSKSPWLVAFGTGSDKDYSAA